MNYYFLKSKERSQTLVLIIFIVVIFSATIAAIAGLTTRELEMEEIGERALQVSYVSESGVERARYVLKGSALRFDKNENNYLNCGKNSSLDISGSLTIEAWIKFLSFDSHMGYIVKGDALGSFGNSNYQFSYHNTTKELQFIVDGIDNSAGVAKYNISNLSTGLWYHIIGVYDKSNSKVKLYINGTLVNESTYNRDLKILTDKELTIGGDTYQSRYSNSIIDEVRIYSRALNSSEVQEHYKGNYTNEPGLVLLQHFEEGPDYCNSNGTPCLSDDSREGNNCTPTNFSNLSSYDIGNSGWTRDYSPERTVFIGGISTSTEDKPSCPDSKLPCGDKNVFNLLGGIKYYYNVTITPNGKQRPNSLGTCSKIYCIDVQVKQG